MNATTWEIDIGNIIYSNYYFNVLHSVGPGGVPQYSLVQSDPTPENVDGLQLIEWLTVAQAAIEASMNRIDAMKKITAAERSLYRRSLIGDE